MNAIDILKEDHNNIINLLTMIASTNRHNVVERRRLFQQLKRCLSVLENMEERLFNNKLLNYYETSSLVLDACAELHLADDIIKKLNTIPVNNEVWSAGVDILKENIESHIKKEAKLFEKVPQVLKLEELEEMGNKMLMVKRILSAS